MNRLLVLLGLMALFGSCVGLITPLAILRSSRIVALATGAAGVILFLIGAMRSADGRHRGAEHMHLDAFLPTYEIHEIHALRAQARPADVFAACKEFTLADLGPARVLNWIRALPARLLGRPAPYADERRPFFGEPHHAGFLLLAEEEDREIVIGMIDKAWTVTGTEAPEVQGPEDFKAFCAPGFVKIAANLRIQPVGEGEVRLSTETRILSTSPEASRKFRLYWQLIYPGSAVLRNALLTVIRKKAERRTGS